MTNKRKSMNTGDDVHAISARYTQYIEGAAAIAKQCSKGFRDVSLTSLGPHGHCLPCYRSIMSAFLLESL